MQANRKTIKNWAPDDRPREKLAANGPDVLSNAELIALLLGSGTRNQSALEVARQLLDRAQQSLGQLGKLSVKELTQVKGIGQARAITIAAALELGRRRQAADERRPVVKSSSDIARYLQAQLRDKTVEVFAVAFLNRANKINQVEIISEGGITGTVADPRIILRKALEYQAVSLVLCHNHPSGNLRPSRADEQLTHKIREAALLLDIQLLDHIIVSDEGYYSFADEGML
ncbi:MAG TPA: DNA repair protein RadC [Lacibacter sp.]|nr:DNA repair protein RadC [Lacibacter sp.]HMO89239.1 DNA repair protein RadC [Lacibacter sp.]